MNSYEDPSLSYECDREQELARLRAEVESLTNALQAVMDYPELRTYIGTDIFDYAKGVLDKAVERRHIANGLEAQP